MRIEIQWNSLFPLSMPYVTTLQYREIFWQNGSLLYGSDTAKQEFFMRLQLRLQSLHKHDFISNQLLFYCWLTQQHFNFSVSFSFKSVGQWSLQDLAATVWWLRKPTLHAASTALARPPAECSQLNTWHWNLLLPMHMMYAKCLWHVERMFAVKGDFRVQLVEGYNIWYGNGSFVIWQLLGSCNENYFTQIFF